MAAWLVQAALEAMRETAVLVQQELRGGSRRCWERQFEQLNRQFQ